MHPDRPAAPTGKRQTPSRLDKPKLHGPGRPRVLDGGKRREICALIAGGCGLREAAQYVDCSITTIRREAERNPDFEQQLRHCEKHAQLNPLRAMQRAILTHWRAAAWFLERAYPDRFGRHEPSAFGIREARALMNELIDVVDVERMDQYRASSLKKSIHRAFDRYIRAAQDRRRNSRSFRRTMKSPDSASQIAAFPDGLGIPTPDIDALMNLPEPNGEGGSDAQQEGGWPELPNHDAEPHPSAKSVHDSDLTSLLQYLSMLPEQADEGTTSDPTLPPQNSNIR